MSFLKIAFMCTVMIDLIGYLPQIKRVLNPEHTLESLSFKAFSIWTFSLFIAFLYAIFEVGDWPLAFVTGMDLLGCGFITAMIFFRRILPNWLKQA